MNRKTGEVVVVMHLAEDKGTGSTWRSSAGERRETLSYFADTLGRPPGRSEDPIRDGVKIELH